MTQTASLSSDLEIAVDLPAMADLQDEHQEAFVLDPVDHAPVADSKAKRTGKSDQSGRAPGPGFGLQTFQRGDDSLGCGSI